MGFIYFNRMLGKTAGNKKPSLSFLEGRWFYNKPLFKRIDNCQLIVNNLLMLHIFAVKNCATTHQRSG
jgi:hypothetical protein